MSEDENDDLILWMLSLTPTQRLEVALGFAESVWELHEGPYQPEDWVTRPLPRDVMGSQRQSKRPEGAQFE